MPDFVKSCMKSDGAEVLSTLEVKLILEVDSFMGEWNEPIDSVGDFVIEGIEVLALLSVGDGCRTPG
jgi:hypothetical protein